MIHTNNEIQEVKELVEKQLGCSIKNITGIRAKKNESIAKKIFIVLMRNYFYTPLKILAYETDITCSVVYRYLGSHLKPLDKDENYKKIYQECLDSFKKLFYDNLTTKEKVQHHQEQLNLLLKELNVKNHEYIEVV